MNQSSQTGRNVYIDALRGTAVILMIQQHLGKWLWDLPWNNIRTLLKEYPLMIGCNALGGLAAPIFVILAGASAYHFVLKNPGRKISLIIRGFLLICLGYLLNVITPGWFSIGAWYVLHLIGFCLILTPLLSHCKMSVLVTLTFIALLVTPVGQEILETPYRLYNKNMGDFSKPGGIFRLLFFEGHFPVFPWLGLFCIGYASGKLVIKNHILKITLLAIVLVVIGALLPALNQLIFHFQKGHYAYRFVTLASRIYPPFPPLLFLLSSAVLILIILYRFFERKNIIKPDSVLVTLGRASLTILIVHIFVFRQLAQWLNCYKKLTALNTGLSIIVILISFGILSKLWSRINYSYGAEWAFRQISNIVGRNR